MIFEVKPVQGLGGFREQDADRSGYAKRFAEIVAGDTRLNGVVLDIGCGELGAMLTDNAGNNIFEPVLRRAARLDGVDPGEGVLRNQKITNRFHALLEEAPIPENAYDAMVGFYVLEHVGTPTRFLRAAAKALKPGGVFYAVTPHARHPFALGTALAQKLGLKERLGQISESDGVNSYPTYNRLNTRAAVARAGREAGFSKATVYFAPCVQWDTYFPKPLRFVPHIYDRLLGSNFTACSQQMMVKLEK